MSRCHEQHLRHLWPTRRIAFADIVGIQVRRHDPLLEHAAGARGSVRRRVMNDERQRGVQLRLAPDLEAALRAGVEAQVPTPRRAS